MTSGQKRARQMFSSLAEATADPPGITRAAYGPGEQLAHNLAARHATELGCEISCDAIGNLYMTLPGEDRGAPAFFVGSHMDTVPHGGNFDGAAGVIAGLSLAATLVENNTVLPRDLVIMAIRAEEATWFPLSYLGSYAAFGKLPATAIDETVRSDTGRTLGWHMREAGFDPEPARQGKVLLPVRRVHSFVEVHIEQGPALIGGDQPIGLVTALNGGFRYTTARCIGRYAHSGATSRQYRQDAVLGFSDFVHGLEKEWDSLGEPGRDVTLTIGQVATDPTHHSGSKVAGEVGFCLDVRGPCQDALNGIRKRISALCDTVARTRGVDCVLGPEFTWPVTQLDEELRHQLNDAASTLNLSPPSMPSGAGHDAAVFAEMGIPTGMIFIRNANGSHNPDEDMDINDFDQAVSLLVAHYSLQASRS